MLLHEIYHSVEAESSNCHEIYIVEAEYSDSNLNSAVIGKISTF